MSESQSPEEIRAEIERTRRELGGDVDALADKVSPSHIVDRQKDRLRDAARSAKDRVFGAADDLREQASDAGDALSDVKDRAVAKAEGSPLAVGLVAFGLGLLVSSLIPASDREKRAAAELREQAQPLVDEAGAIAREVGGHLQEPAQDAVEAVKETATDAVEHVRSSGESAVHEVQDQTRRSAGRVADS